MSFLGKILGIGNQTDWDDPNARWDGTDEHWEHLQGLNKSTRYKDNTGEGDWMMPSTEPQGRAARMSRGEARSIYRQVAKSTNGNEIGHEEALAEGARRLDGMCQTGARVTGGNAFRSKVEYHFNKDHGFGFGRSGHVEVVDSRTVVIYK